MMMPFIIPKSPNYVKFDDNRCIIWLPTQRLWDIFISKGSYKFWSTWMALSKHRNPLKSFRVYKYQPPKIKNHEVLTCLNCCSRFSLLPGVGCQCLALYVLLKLFTNLTLELRNICFPGGGPNVCSCWLLATYVAQLLLLYSRTWNVSTLID